MSAGRPLSEREAVLLRRRRILDYVMTHDGAQIDDLAARCAASRMTIHRDLNALAEQGLVRKVRGGVTTSSNGIVESSFLHRSRRAAAEKRAIAALAVTLIQPGDVVALDDSTTSRFLAERLAGVMPLTVVTNSLGIATMLSQRRDCHLVMLGGQYHPTFDAFLGLLCEQAIGALRANTVFMSVSAIHGLAAYHQEQDIVKAKHALMRIVDRRVLMVDSRKFGISALNHLADLSEFDIVITDSGLEAPMRARLRDAGIDLRIAGPHQPPAHPGDAQDEDAQEMAARLGE
jgi:DeoR/GlpR family transcriptional regulator of sugar metabolism